MKVNKKVLGGFIALVLIILFLSGCLKPESKIQFKEAPRFESYSELKAAFEEADTQYWRYGGGPEMAFDMGMPTASAESSAIGGVSKGGGVDYSTTNIQVAGVDEADIVKSDGKFIYNFSKDMLIITDAYPIESAQIVSRTSLSDINPQELFVSGDKLLLFGSKSEYYGGPEPMAEIAPGGYYPYYSSSSAVIRLYDVSDCANPVLEKEIEFEGSYLTSRLIGQNAYFVVNSWPHICYKEDCDDIIIPLMKVDGQEERLAEATEIAYLPPMPAESFVTIASLNLDSQEMKKEVVAGNAQNVFASMDNIYLSATTWLPPETFAPEDSLAEDVEKMISEYTEKTVVNKFGLVDGEIKFVGQGQVPGHVLNQFSMDEFEGNFRIATTGGQLSRWGSQTSNNLYVLNENMELIGSLEDLAPGESIYSARFMGKKAYLVTFRKIDPLFVIDVSDPTNPKVLGKLKIPGYSDYLHPLDETHLIGVGKETIASSKGDWAWHQGLKMAVFDVSDVSNPIEMHKVVIGDRGTDSYALRDHKAFLYDREKELLVLPILLTEIQEKSEGRDDYIDWPEQGEPVFQGAFVFKLTLENGFEERGRITHISEEEELKRGYYYGDDYSVKRAMYIGNVLYTLSEKMLKANDLSTLADLKEFVFLKK